jgi:putative ABC transport system permease protein
VTIVTTVIAVAVLTVVAFVIVAALRLERPWLQPWAILRAIVQLGLLSLVLAGIIDDPLLVATFLALMVIAAAWTTSRRLGLPPLAFLVVIGVTAVASAVPVAVLFGLGAIEPTPRYALAVGGIVVGNVMTVSTLFGRALAQSLVARRDEVEGWLALGATPRRAALDCVRSAGTTALVPSTDQTRTTGIVTLPGAFVGSIFAGASPLAAAQFQLVVLAGILCAGAVAVALLAVWRGAPRVLPQD